LSSSDRLLQTLSDIMELSRLQAGKVASSRSVVNLSELLPDVVANYKKMAQDKGLAFQLVLPGVNKQLFVRSNTGCIASILHKLLSNAVKFTERGSIEVGYYLDESHATVYVKDTGIGVDVSKHPFIFDEFRQVYESTSRNYDGNGLGLNIAKRLVDILGGSILVSPNAEKGSVFSFRFPID
jgi:signal transduction histidine kinase